jgi:cobalt transporter subunit CbtA
MNIFRNAVFVAAIAGLVAGIFMTALQSFYTVPLILQAEIFENTGPAHDHTAPATADPAPVAVHEHDEKGWAPANGVERIAFTALTNIVTGVGFALLLVVGSELAGGILGWRQGLFWGFAGFAVFTLAPSLGLSPGLPAMPAADLVSRQIWWIATVVATAAGLWLIVFRGSALFVFLGVALIVAPHVVGAPQPVSHDSPVPADLHHRFVVAVTITNLVFWMLLGAAIGVIRPRFASGLAEVQGSLA